MTSVFDIRNAQLTLGTHLCMDDLSVSITHGQRIGLMGQNGSGKSSLIKCLAGEISLDSGRIITNQSLSIHYLSQSLPDSSTSAFEYLNIHQQPLSSEHHFWVKDVNLEKPINTLSGGQKQRLKILKAIQSMADVLLLDEPTNHLDITSLTLLESWLKTFTGTLIIVAHDYTFIENLCDQFIWLKDGEAFKFKGTLPEFMDYQNNVFDQAVSHHKKLIKKQDREFDWMYNGGVTARRKRNQKRVEAFNQLKETIKNQAPKNTSLKLSSNSIPKSGEVLLQAQSISDSNLFKPFDLVLRKDDKLAIVGPNGIGKTTLLSYLLNLKEHKGTSEWASKASYAYLDQHQNSLKPNQTLIENLDAAVAGDKQQELLGFLNDFQFSREQAYSRVSNFSGGQKQRACLAQILLRPTNLLILDEPTNDLDLMSVEALIDYLDQYSGALIFISHNRRLIDQVANKVLHISPDGHVIIDHQLNTQLMQTSVPDVEPNNPHSEKKGAGKKAQLIKKVLKRIDTLEKRLQEIINQLGDPKLYTEKNSKLDTLQANKKEIEQELEESYEEWTKLEDD